MPTVSSAAEVRSRRRSIPSYRRRRRRGRADRRRRPTALARDDRERDRRGEGAGRGRELPRDAFNLATNGHRQPGSAFKPFILLTALEGTGRAPGACSRHSPRSSPFTERGRAVTVVLPLQLRGPVPRLGARLATATAKSDNSVFAELGMKVGRESVAGEARTWAFGRTVQEPRHAARWTPGGRHATRDGVRVLDAREQGGACAAGAPSSAARWRSRRSRGGIENKTRSATKGVFPQEVADTAKTMLSTWSSPGPGRARRWRVRGRQDGHHGELRRRLVLRLHRQVHDVRVGRLSRQGAADGDRVRRQPGGGRHMARLDLGRFMLPASDPRPARGRGRGRGRRPSTTAGPYRSDAGSE